MKLKIEAGQQERHHWGSMTWLVNNALFPGSAVSSARMLLRAGQAAPLHCHETCWEYLFVHRGDVLVTIGKNEPSPVSASHSIEIPPNTAHAVTNLSQEDAEIFITYTSGDRDFVDLSGS